MKIRCRIVCLVWAAVVGAGVLPANARASKQGVAEHVVVVVWDGMRPDFITPQYCPNLYSLATNGVFFRRHHPVYISTTEVNGAALATGASPGRNGILANEQYKPQISTMAAFATEGFDAVRRGDLLSGGHYILVPTVAEILQTAGFPTVIAGTKPVALLQDRAAKKVTLAQKTSVTLFGGKTLPREARKTLVNANDDKPFPAVISHPNTSQDAWTTKSLLQSLWKTEVPKFTLLWLSEPDKSQHESGVGSPMALAGIESSDHNLGEVIAFLKEHQEWEKTDLMVVSDHGFSTIYGGPDIAEILRKQNFFASSKLECPETGDVLVVGLGGSVSLYVIDREEAVIRRLVSFLQTTEFAGVIFSRLPIEGTFPLETVAYSAANDPPDLIVSLRWKADRNEHGAPGLILTTGGTPGKGSHGSLCPRDMNNTLVAFGPDFKHGFASETPSGNIDVAPTALWILGLKPPPSMDGRVLREALAAEGEVAPKVTEKRIEATRDAGPFRWIQYLKMSDVGGTRYFDEGNGEVLRR
jgi:predicted AlkP superfamily pyrophosphatase or phosphodiesterase